MADRKLPQSLQNRMGDLKLSKGTVDGIRLIGWDLVSECRGDQCPAFNACDYTKIGKCTVEKQYMKNLWLMIFDNFMEDLTEPQLFQIGTHLIPLYRTLCRFKIAEAGITSVTYLSGAGKVAVEPIYKEIREQIKVIGIEWKRLGLRFVTGMEIDPTTIIES